MTGLSSQYCGHDGPPDHKSKVFIAGQRRRVTATIKRELRRCSTIEPVIDHAEAEYHGDTAHAILAAAGYNLCSNGGLFCCPQVLAAVNAMTSRDRRLKPRWDQKELKECGQRQPAGNAL